MKKYENVMSLSFTHENVVGLSFKTSLLNLFSQHEFSTNYSRVFTKL